MSGRNAATVQRLFEASARLKTQEPQDWAAFEATVRPLLAPDVEFQGFPKGNAAQEAGVPWIAHRVGVEDCLKHYQAVNQVLRFSKFEPTRILEAEDKVLVWLDCVAEHLQTGKQMGDLMLMEYTMSSEGQVRAARFWMDTKRHIDLHTPAPA